MLPGLRARVAVGIAACGLLVGPALALQPRQDGGLLEGRTWAETDAQPSLVFYEAGRADVPSEMARFLAEQGGRWEVRWDARNERPHLVQGSGVPLLPGRGNRLTRAQAGLGPGDEVRLEDVERLVRAFMARYPEMFRIAPQSLRLDRERSAASGALWFVELQQYQQGVPVVGAKVFFRINNGNIVQFGADRIAEVGIGVQPALGASEARERGLDALGSSVADVAETLDAGRLEIDPVLTQGERAGEPYDGLAGFGYDHVLVWRSTVRLRSDDARYQLTVDARTGALLRAEGLERYATAKASGGIYPLTAWDTEVVKGLGFLAVTNSTPKYTNAAGAYDYSGGTASSTMNGKYVQVSDSCGPISLSNSTFGTLAFGSSGWNDCTTPGVGGSGNTHAARNAFYHLTKINRLASTYLPGNAWLNTKVAVNTNSTSLTPCNSAWNGSTATFSRSDSSLCNNPGEVSSILFHEWGHALDQNTGGTSSDPATGEALGDTFAFLQTKLACIGYGLGYAFAPPYTQCPGVRDVSAFTIAGSLFTTWLYVTPANSANLQGSDESPCGVTPACNPASHGPLGYEAHCESLIASGANWDLAEWLVHDFGIDPGWNRMEGIWYRSLVSAKSAYRVVSGGTNCNTAATTDGCLADNWYSVYLAVNDDDGNLANGTPDACRIFGALKAHGMACGVQPACTSPALPTPTPTPTPPPPTPTPAIGTPTPAVPTPTPTPLPPSIVNGGFEGSPPPPWVFTGMAAWGGWPGAAHTGSGFAVVHNLAIPYSTSSGAVYQTVAIPLNATGLLGFWLKVVSEEATTTTTYDQLFVEVRSTSGDLLATVAAFSNLDAATPSSPYNFHSYDVSAFKGQTVRFQFRATQDGSLDTQFRVDDVSLQ